MTTLDHEYVSWTQYIDLCERLVARVGLSGWKFDSLICLARGGMRPGDVFSRVYGKPLAVLSTSSYREEAGTVQGDLSISKHITGVDALKGKVLLVDDLCDSGKTISKVIVHLKHEFPEIEEIRVAAIWVKAQSVLQPDYYVVKFDGNPWIHQPFECYDDISIERHLENCRKKFGEDHI
ncbi:MAG: phosphoribosyltransferase [Duodenibacillus sp.]|nr:phosphoribosyltransferase [Duodenibacillus sp.]